MPSRPEKANADRMKRYYANIERERQRGRDYYALNREKRIAAQRQTSREYYQAWKARNPDGLWIQWLKAGHGMLPEQWFAMLVEQAGRCYLCEELLPDDDRKQIAVDHDHACCGEKRSCRYCRRGLTHKHCNWLLGILKEDLAAMRAVCSAHFVANFERTQSATQALLAVKPAQEALQLDVAI